MKLKQPYDEIVHWRYDMPDDYREIEDCFLSNLEAPVVRFAGRTFKSYYAVEWCYFGYHIIDPTRSLARMVARCVEKAGISPWPQCDFLHMLMRDLGFNPFGGCVTLADRAAFWTMFPGVMYDFLADSYVSEFVRFYPKPDHSVFRVINNPFFYRDAHASEKRLVVLAETDGVPFALDRTKVVPTPRLLAYEIAVLNHGLHNEGLVRSVRDSLIPVIAEAMSDCKLTPKPRDPVRRG